MAKGDVHVIGLPELRHTLTNLLPREAKNVARRTVTRVAAIVRNEMRKKAPKDEGDLRKAIRSRRERGTHDTVEASVNIGRRAFYWRFLEDGTQEMSARPFVTPAVEEVRKDIPRIYRDEFGRQLEKELAKKAKKARAR